MIQALPLRYTSAALLALGIAFAGAPARAQVAETEPNSSCLSAQDLSASPLPVTVAGSLDTPPTTPDVDYYRITGTPGELIRIEQRGMSSGSGTLFDPFLGVMTSTCGYLYYSDDYIGLEARVEVTVPADGVIVVAATSAWDWEFSGYGSYAGSYTLKVAEVKLAEGLGGRVVNTNTGVAVADALVWLLSCDNGGCERYEGYTLSGPDGSFRFEPGNFTLYDGILRAGEYRVMVIPNSSSYRHYEGSPFQILEGQDLDLGNLGVQPVPIVGSIRGRLVDAVTGAPLAGDIAPFGRADLQSCSPVYGCWTVRYGNADAQGQFIFESNLDRPLSPGSYRILANADQYQPTAGPEFEVAADEHLDLGDFAVKSFPVRLNVTQACSSVPSTGGDCPFVVRVTNGNPSKLSGDVWTLVQSIPYNWNGQSTEFQAGRKTVSLQPGTSTDVSFTFTVPASLEDGSAICARAFTSHKTNPFETIGSRDLFCVAKVGTTFQRLPDQEKRELLKKTGNR